MYATTVSRKLELTYEKTKLCSNNIQLCYVKNGPRLILKHGCDENLVTVRSNISFPGDIIDMHFEVDERDDYRSNDDESSDDKSADEYLYDSSDSEESDTEYYKIILK